MARIIPISTEILEKHLDMMIRLAYMQEEESEIETLINKWNREFTTEEIKHKDIAFSQFIEKIEHQNRQE